MIGHGFFDIVFKAHNRVIEHSEGREKEFTAQEKKYGYGIVNDFVGLILY